MQSQKEESVFDMTPLESFLRYELDTTFVIELLVPLPTWAILIVQPRRDQRRDLTALTGCTLLMAVLMLVFRIFCIYTMPPHHYQLAHIVFQGAVTAVFSSLAAATGPKPASAFGVPCFPAHGVCFPSAGS